MDGENNGSKPYEQMDDFGGVIHVKTPIFGLTPISPSHKFAVTLGKIFPIILP